MGGCKCFENLLGGGKAVCILKAVSLAKRQFPSDFRILSSACSASGKEITRRESHQRKYKMV